MSDPTIRNKQLETVAEGTILVLFGVLSLVPGDQNDLFVLGIGIILLGVNLVRFLSKIPVVGFSTTLGVIAFTFGSLAVLRPVLGWSSQFEITILPVLFIAIGVYWLIPSPKQIKKGSD